MRVLMMPDYRGGNPYQTLLSDALRADGVDVEFARGYRRVLPIARAMRAARAAVLHLHWVDPYARPTGPLTEFVGRGLKTLVDLALVRASGARIVWTVHNELSHDSRHPRLERLFLRAVEALADQVIVHEEVRRETHPGAVVIPHGPLGSVYRDPVPTREARQALGIDVPGRLYLHLSLLRPYKGIEGLLEAWRETGLGERNLLLIAGAPADRAYGEALAARAKGVKGVRLLLEFVPDDLVHLYFSAADLVVLPFTRVATSSSVLLALAFGKPLVVPRLPTIAETLGDPAPALYYEPNERDGLSRALETAATLDLAPLVALAAARAGRFDWAAIGRATRATYMGGAAPFDADRDPPSASAR